MNKKTSSILGLITSIVFAVIGLLILCEVFGGSTGSLVSPYNYDYGYATFGADFYNYVSNNAAYSAKGIVAVYNTLSSLNDLLKNVFGFLFIGIGLFGICHFAPQIEKKAKETPEIVSAETPYFENKTIEESSLEEEKQ